MNQYSGITFKLLYIEGHSILRDAFFQLLQFSDEYEVIVAVDGRDGVQKALTVHPDLILMGLKMPRMNGYEVIKTLRKNPTTVHTPIIVVSAWADAKSKRRALDAGANEHITPPVDIHWLIRRINSYLHR
jgi:CheY-like chemotaxis protein